MLPSATTWEALGLVWLVGLAFNQAHVRSQEWGSRIFHLGAALSAFSCWAARYFRQDG